MVVAAGQFQADASNSARVPSAPPNANAELSFTSEHILTPDTDTPDSDLFTMADPASVLTAGSLEMVGQGQIPENPILQCVQIKPMASQHGNERYRVVMNDSRNYIQGMLAQGEWRIERPEQAGTD